MKISVIIPAYNEAAGIEDTLTELARSEEHTSELQSQR